MVSFFAVVKTATDLVEEVGEKLVEVLEAHRQVLRRLRVLSDTERVNNMRESAGPVSVGTPRRSKTPKLLRTFCQLRVIRLCMYVIRPDG